MNTKKIGIGIVAILVVALIAFFGYFVFIKQDEKTTLTLMDKKWIEENKNTLVDFGIVNGIPIFSYEGNGVFFEFIHSLEEDTGLEFNLLSYTLGAESPSDYAFSIVNEVGENDILLYKDNYALISNTSFKYGNLESIPSMVVGVLEDDLKDANYYLKYNAGLSFKTYNDTSKLEEALKNGEVGSILLPKTIYMKSTATLNTFYINYNFTEMNKYIVLHLGDNERLNGILTKYYKNWSSQNLETIFNSYFSDMYLAFNDIAEQDDTQFRSKNYTYGFVSMAPYDKMVNGRLVGTNKEMIKAFAKSANIDIKYKEFDSIEDMMKSFNENKIDFMFNVSANTEYEMDVIDTVSTYDEKMVVASSISNNITVNTLSSLYGKEVYALKNSALSEFLKNENIKVHEFENDNDMLNSIHRDSVLLLDYATYETYSKNKLSDFKVDYLFSSPYEYRFTVRNIGANTLFINYFNFYLSFMNENTLMNKVSYKEFDIHLTSMTAFYILMIGIVILCVTFGIVLYNRVHNKKKKNNGVLKENKLRYVDMLTSLKNRNYLNDSIESWDESEIYPQSIIIVDLNNVAYINDNYGHEEGDKVIAEAANILIQSQVENSEIIRTNGNEFLIYMVAYEEKQVVAYIRKLHKEFKELSHGFGAAIGYSMIHDAIKTIDDAINEATLDMKSNKEEINN